MSYRRIVEPLIGEERVCNECGDSKDLSLFGKALGCKEDRNPRCKDCKAKYNRDWYKNQKKKNDHISSFLRQGGSEYVLGKNSCKETDKAAPLHRSDFNKWKERLKKLDGKTRECFGHMCTTCENPQVIMHLTVCDENENVYDGDCARCGSSFQETVSLKKANSATLPYRVKMGEAKI